MKYTNLQNGMKVTVESYSNGSSDRSYIGSVLEIDYIDLPFVIVTQISKFNGREKTSITLDINNTKIKLLTDEFVTEALRNDRKK